MRKSERCSVCLDGGLEIKKALRGKNGYCLRRTRREREEWNPLRGAMKYAMTFFLFVPHKRRKSRRSMLKEFEKASIIFLFFTP